MLSLQAQVYRETSAAFHPIWRSWNPVFDQVQFTLIYMYNRIKQFDKKKKKEIVYFLWHHNIVPKGKALDFMLHWAVTVAAWGNCCREQRACGSEDRIITMIMTIMTILILHY